MIEESAGEFDPAESFQKLEEAGLKLGKQLELKLELIERLHPPPGCVKVQEEGRKQLFDNGRGIYQLYENLTPELQRRLPRDLNEVVGALGKLERKAEAC